MGERFVPEEVVNSIIQEGRTEIPTEKLEQKRYVAPNELWIKDTHLRKPVIPPKPDETLPRKGADGLIKTSYLDLLRDGAIELGENRVRLLSATPVGGGGFGNVYKAFDEKLGMPVALKVGRSMNRTFDLEREAKAMANINHPGVVKIYDFTIQNAPDGRGLPVIVEEFMDPKEAPCLHDKLRLVGHLYPREIEKAVSELSQTIDYLYFEKGMLHGDLKPANIFLDRHFTKMGDFGLASYVHNKGYGSYDYNAPEKHGQTTNTLQSDVYSLGVITFEMVTGHLPLNGADESMFDVNYFYMEKMGAVYSKAQTERLRVVLTKVLSIKPEDRYQTATEFAQALEEALKED